ncbi:hypothetical protein EHQ12_08605 [Leptospira gomenensis]|uniref:Uncharacterized protein n=1 Tax=Leptospira gomenensis TaxID=2484974 RepID=A0A5F1YQ61_9LEPT|nr:hypothetical protein [Leptospira gomenensis]TGK33833.1 hypothetical protein EHQ17_10015 [Leptospira gomenensis]TGK39957.1 hypothetical protein EHQ12_08605 [Leptospira gomenensis]TGK40228.1 hypothetical protein EHQ07_18585 [Leptospira gomenensis]TGK59893.1 hypothetical protein EHQ13_11745 [Leptospira gomenensis]
MKRHTRTKTFLQSGLRSLLYVAASLWLVTNCNLPNDDDSFNRENEQRVILQYLLLPPTNPLQSCVSSLQAAKTCLDQAPDLPTPLTEVEIVTLFSGNATFGTYQNYCTGLLSSATFSKFTDRAKACLMDCNKVYWENRNSSGTCSQSGVSQITGLSTGTFACTKTCISISGE